MEPQGDLEKLHILGPRMHGEAVSRVLRQPGKSLRVSPQLRVSAKSLSDAETFVYLSAISTH